MKGCYKTNGNIFKIFTKYVAVHPTAVSENYSSPGMFTILIGTFNHTIFAQSKYDNIYQQKF